jgi:hypothetical protein
LFYSYQFHPSSFDSLENEFLIFLIYFIVAKSLVLIHFENYSFNQLPNQIEQLHQAQKAHTSKQPKIST